MTEVEIVEIVLEGPETLSGFKRNRMRGTTGHLCCNAILMLANGHLPRVKRSDAIRFVL